MKEVPSTECRVPSEVAARKDSSSSSDLRPRIVQTAWSGVTCFVLLDRPILCGLCGEMHSVLVNDGWTRCLICWLEKRRAAWDLAAIRSGDERVSSSSAVSEVEDAS